MHELTESYRRLVSELQEERDRRLDQIQAAPQKLVQEWQEKERLLRTRLEELSHTWDRFM